MLVLILQMFTSVCKIKIAYLYQLQSDCLKRNDFKLCMILSSAVSIEPVMTLGIHVSAMPFPTILLCRILSCKHDAPSYIGLHDSDNLYVRHLVEVQLAKIPLIPLHLDTYSMKSFKMKSSSNAIAVFRSSLQGKVYLMLHFTAPLMLSKSSS